jgi:hypothetical protein
MTDLTLELKFPKLEYLEPLKPLNVEKLKMNVSGTQNVHSMEREHLENVEPKIPKLNSELFAPINVFGDLKNPEDQSSAERTFCVPKTIQNQRFQNKKPGSKILNPLYYKTRSMHTEYNSLMNSLYPGTEIPEMVVSEPSVLRTELERSSELRTEGSEAKQTETLYSEDPVEPSEPSVLSPSDKVQDLGSVNRQNVKASLQELFETSEATRSALECSKVIIPKNYDLEESLDIICLDISKKNCVVWYEGITISYAKFRENPEHIVFFVGTDAYGYSKKMLFEEYTSSRSSMYSDRSIYFDLNLNWEDNETLWIPMSQIAKLLEFSHPVYEIQKMKYSMSVWNLIPVKLKK